jgi:hypothetical protein
MPLSATMSPCWIASAASRMTSSVSMRVPLGVTASSDGPHAGHAFGCA